VRGKTDADAVFGMIYAQAEDDFNRIETNYLTNLGRLAEAEGEKAIWSDLRYRLFLDHDDLKTRYAASPPWLQRLMTAWADGLNHFLASNPQVRPRVLTRFEPWMALSFTEGSIGADFERVPLEPLRKFYAGGGEVRPAWRPPSGQVSHAPPPPQSPRHRRPPRRTTSRAAPTASPSRRRSRRTAARSSSSTRTPASSSAPSCR
jgi:acyl-homoserine lactone acylase PvdQ